MVGRASRTTKKSNPGSDFLVEGLKNLSQNVRAVPISVQAEKTRAAAIRAAKSLRKNTTGFRFRVKDRGPNRAGRFVVEMLRKRAR